MCCVAGVSALATQKVVVRDMAWKYLSVKYKNDDDSDTIIEWCGGAGDFAKEIIGLKISPIQRLFLNLKGFFFWAWNNRG